MKSYGALPAVPARPPSKLISEISASPCASTLNCQASDVCCPLSGGAYFYGIVSRLTFFKYIILYMLPYCCCVAFGQKQCMEEFIALAVLERLASVAKRVATRCVCGGTCCRWRCSAKPMPPSRSRCCG